MTISTPPSRNLRILLARAVLAAGVLTLLLSAIWAGLLRLGWALPAPQHGLAALHGPLFVCGMLGALIGLERAVALGRPWAFIGPLLTLASGLGLLAGLPVSVGALLLSAASLSLLLVFAALIRRQPAQFVVTMALGAVCWLGGNLLWLGGRPLAVASLWWAGFLVLTIVGERLELGRLRQLPSWTAKIFALGVVTVLLGLGVTVVAYAPGVRLTGAGFVILGLWLLAFDIARRTIRRPGLPGFSATCILSGSLWLVIAGMLALITPPAYAGPGYDALLHAVFVGFVFAMIFGHAPIIVPALLQIPLKFNRWSYLPLVALHLSLLMRVAGDLTLRLDLRRWGGMLNAMAIAIFLLLTLISALQARWQRQPTRRAPPAGTLDQQPAPARNSSSAARSVDDGQIIEEVQDGTA